MSLNFKLYEIPKINAPKFTMSPVEYKNYFDFKAKRLYFITKTLGETGSHCHKIEKEFFIMVQGSCVAVIDRGYGLEEYKITGPTSAMYIGNYVWHHFKDFTDDAILLAISSTNYDSTRADYIENYDEFKNLTYNPNPQQKKLLVLGYDGTLGAYISSVFSKDNNYEVICSTKNSIDLREEEVATKTITELKPNIIINCVAHNNVDLIETDENEFKNAQKLNGNCVELLANIANQINATLVHFGTDYIFDGENLNGYDELAKANPISKYGQTKLLGEEKIKQATKHYLIRTSRLFGIKGKSNDSKRNFIDTMLELAITKNELNIINEEVSSPTFAKDLAERVKFIIDSNLEFGVYNATNDGQCSWYEFANEAFKIKNISIKTNPVSGEFLQRPAKRPKYSVLLQTKTTKMRNWKDALMEYLTEL